MEGDDSEVLRAEGTSPNVGSGVRGLRTLRSSRLLSSSPTSTLVARDLSPDEDVKGDLSPNNGQTPVRRLVRGLSLG